MKKSWKKKATNSRNDDSISTAEGVKTKSVVPISNAEEADNDLAVAPEHNHHSWVPSNVDSRSVGVSESDVEQERHKTLEAKCVELLEEIMKLEVEKNVWSQKEDSLEKKIKLLQHEVDSSIQREAILEEKIDDLQSKNASLTLREASVKEDASKLGDANEGLQIQIMELKECRDSLIEENTLLTESISTLESRIHHLTSFHASSKVCEMHAEGIQLTGSDENDIAKSAAEERESTRKENESFSVNGIQDDSRVSEDVFSVPLMNDDIIQELEGEEEEREEAAEYSVPLSDAPLIGSPFRLLSFVAKYVSGADLLTRPGPADFS